MGQFALGIRSLLIKGAVFFVMAALLAWTLGGALWPRTPQVAVGPVTFAGGQYELQLSQSLVSDCTGWQIVRTGTAEPIAAGTAEDCVISVNGPNLSDDVLQVELRCAGNRLVRVRVDASGVAAVERLRVDATANPG